MILLKQMLIFLFLMFLGYFMARKGVLGKEVCKSISWLIVNVANPALVISSCAEHFLECRELLFTLVLAVGLYLMMILVAEIVVPFFHLEKQKAGVYKAMIVFSNMGFMGFPMMSAMYGPESLMYGSVFLIPFNLFIYTYGISIISGTSFSPAEALKKCMNVGVVSVLITVVLSVFRISLPGGIAQTVSMLGDLTGPLCMLVIGASFVGISFRELFRDGKLLLMSVMRLLLIPVLGLFVVRAFTGNTLLQSVSFIILATPVGSMVPMLTQEYEGDYVTASKGVALTMLLAVVTMPLLFMMMGLE